MKQADQEFLHNMATQLDETIKKLVIEEKVVAHKIGDGRVEELTEYWRQALSEEEEKRFTLTLDYWDKILLRIWARSKRAHLTRAQVGQALMKSNSN